MKLRFTTLLWLLIGTFSLQAQIVDPVKWSFTSQKVADDKYDIICTAKVDNGWYIYSQDNSGEGPVPTSFTFETLEGAELQSKMLEERGQLIDKFDKVFEMQVKKFSHEVSFVAHLTITAPVAKASGYVEFMTCDDTRCLPPNADNEFTFEFKREIREETPPAKPSPETPKPAEKTPVKENPVKESGTTSISNDTKNNQTQNAAPAKTEQVAEAPKKEPPVKEKEVVEIDETQTFSNEGILRPVIWSYAEKDLGNNEYELTFMAKVDKGWYIYSQDNSQNDGPVPTSIFFKVSEDYEPMGAIEEKGDVIKKFDKFFNREVKKYKDSVTFVAKVKRLKPEASIEGSLEFMVCDDTRCLPPETVDFYFDPTGNSPPKQVSIDVTDAVMNGEFDTLIADCGKTRTEDEGRSLWLIFILGLLGGFAALLTPCVFPMIPLTVSFFTKRSKDRQSGLRNAIIYAISIVVIYVLLGFLVTKIFGPETLNELAANMWFNLAFFVIFVVFAISFFGYFEITLPSSWVNKADEASERGGLIGIFFMAFTLALVSFSCTGPIIGTLLVEAAVQGKNLGPVVGMTGFAVALALPFALFAMFPGWLNSLPRSGGWLNSVKVVLGFIELIFALKFLSNADMVPQWGLLPREIFVGIWIVLILALALYLFGFIRFPHDSPNEKPGLLRKGLGVLSVAMALYLMTDFWGGNIGLISGFPPPKFYSLQNKHDEGHIEGIRSLDEGLAKANLENTPVLLDFTGWACVNCRKMEENVWPKMKSLINQYTLVSLYVDESVALPKEQQFTYELNGQSKKVRTVGNKWSYLQTKCFNINSQPYYVLMNVEGKLLAVPRGYTPNVDEYARFLEEGLQNYKSGKLLFAQE
ncbi:MAG: protein-disulfide reductase DsbD family protein [Chitinophagales bacterium]|nr:hypothetical protein [Bacteroidota bacterium]